MPSAYVRDIPPSSRHPKTRYQAVYRDHTGKQRSAGIHDTKKAAKSALAAVVVEIDAGAWRDPVKGKVTVKDYAEQWLASRQVERSTYGKLAAVVRNQIVPTFGEMQLRAVQPSQVKGWVAGMSQTLKPTSVRTYLNVFRSMMNSAVLDDMLATSPVRLQRGDLPRVRGTETCILSQTQLTALLEAVDPHYRAMVYLAAWTGMRYGEIAGLQWPSVNLSTGMVTVEVSLAKDAQSKLYLAKPKTESSHRVVSIDPETARIMKEHRLSRRGRGYVFQTPSGVPVRHQHFYQSVWNPAVTKAFPDGPRPTFHDLRHSHATHLLASGVDPVTVARRLGHSSTKMTLDTYGGLREDHVFVIDQAIKNLRKSS